MTHITKPKPYKFKNEDRVRKIIGSYEADGIIKARFRAADGSPRYVFQFNVPYGLLHIFGESQLSK